MKIFILIIIICLFSISLEAQTIISVDFGDSALKVKDFVGLTVQSSSNHNVDMDVQYYNGIIADVKLFVYNQYIMDFGITASFCRHYIMEDGLLAKIIIQYYAISLEQLQNLYDNLIGKEYEKVGNYYYKDNFSTRISLYLADNGFATAEEEKTDLSNLPKDVRKTIAEKIKENEEIEKQKQLAIDQKKIELEQKKQKAIEMETKIYDLGKYDTLMYNETFTKIKDGILRNCGWDYNYDPQGFYQIPTYDDLKNKNNKKFIIRNTYNIDLKPYNNYYHQENEFKLVAGKDTACNLLWYYLPTSPSIKINDYEVSTEAKYYNVNVVFSRGITTAKLEKGNIKFTDNKPEEEFQSYIANQIISEMNKYPADKVDGDYYVEYEASNINGGIEVNINKIVKNENTFWGSALLYGGGAVAIILGVLDAVHHK